MSVVSLNDHDRARVRHHLGYTSLEVSSSLSLGVPNTTQTSFMLESNMSRLRPESVGIVMSLLGKLDATEEQMFGANARARAEAVDEIKLRADEFDELKKRYRFWAEKLAGELGAVINIFAPQFRDTVMGGGINVRVEVPS